MTGADHPLDNAVVDQAVQWLVLLWSGDADARALDDWRRWRSESPEHERAWQQIEAVNGRLSQRMHGVSGATAITALNGAGAQRRRAVKMLSLLAIAGGLGWSAQRTLPWREWTADAHTAHGERRELTLADGTQVLLNTDTAIDVRYDARQRLLQLQKGEVLIASATDTQSPSRPLIVATPVGRVRALGTRFTVREQGSVCRVAVLEGAVELSPAASGAVVRLDAGQRAQFTASEVSPSAAVGGEAAWVDGVLVASDTRLIDFIADLQRYHRADLRCDPRVAELRLSGVFPLQDPDRVLNAIGKILPIELHASSRLWMRSVTLGPRA